MKTLTKTLGIIGMMTILGTGTMFGSTKVNDKNHKNGCVVVINNKFDKKHNCGKDFKMDKDFNGDFNCNCKTCMELKKKNGNMSINMNDNHMKNMNMDGKNMNDKKINDKKINDKKINDNSGMKNNSIHSVKNMNNNNKIINGRR